MQGSLERIDVASLKAAMKSPKPPLVLDVRDGEEFDASHVPGAIHALWYDMLERVSGIKKTREIVVYCHSGPRAVKAAHELAELGYTNVKVLKRGFVDWE